MNAEIPASEPIILPHIEQNTIAAPQQALQDPQASHPFRDAHPWVLHFSHIWRKVLFVLLCLLALEELTSAVSFFVFEYPHLDAQLKEHLLSDTEMKHLTARAFAESANSVLNMFFATRLMKARERLTHVLDLISGSTLVIWQETVTRWLEALNIPTLWEKFF